MSGIPVNVAVEDELSEWVVLKLLAVTNRSYHVGATYRRGGFGYLRRTINGWNAAARGKPFVVLTDLDDAPCPADLIGRWLTSAQNPNLIFRVAVREVEAWLLADFNNLATFLRVKKTLLWDASLLALAATLHDSHRCTALWQITAAFPV
jgi:hypothetical protein